MRAPLFVALHPYVRRRSPDKACPQRRERHDDEHGRQHVDHGKDFDAAHAQPRGDEDDAAAGGKVAEHSRRHVRGEEGGGSIEQGEDGELGYGDEADREAEKRPEHNAAEQIENGLGEEDVRGPGDAFVYRAEDAHAAEAERDRITPCTPRAT